MKHTSLFASHVKDLTEPKADGEAVGLCPFHPDTNPSFSVNLESGKWKCHGGSCGKSGGAKKFKELVGVGEKMISSDEVTAHHQALLRSPKILNYLTVSRGLSKGVIERYRLGYDGERIWIPILDGDEIVNVRKYQPGAKRNRMISYGKGYGTVRLYPTDQLSSDRLILCEGEFDALCAISHGHPAVTGTGGAGNWPTRLNRLLAGKQVTILYDADKAGVAGAGLVARSLSSVARVAVGNIAAQTPRGGKDVSDVLVSGGSLASVVADAEGWEAPSESREPSEETVPVHLSESSFSDLAFRRVKTNVIVAGKDLAPYTVPYRIRYTCEGGEDRCVGCGIAMQDGEWEFQFQEWHQEILQMIAAKNNEVHAVVSRIAKVPNRCKQFDWEVLEYTNVESVKCIPEIDWSTEEAPYVIRQLFYLGHGLEANRSYELEAVAMPDPKTQYATALIYAAELAQSNIDTFKIEDMREELEVFQV